MLGTDTALLNDPELRPYVEVYAHDEGRFLTDFADAFRRLTWLGNPDGDSGLVTATTLRGRVRGVQG